ncbi:MAG: beta-ketoacyl reductase [Pseudonocardiaceae bacterium]
MGAAKIGKTLVKVAEALAAAAVVFLAVWLMIKTVLWALRQVVIHWRTSITVVAVLAWWHCWGWPLLAATGAVVTSGLLVWRLVDLMSFDGWGGSASAGLVAAVDGVCTEAARVAARLRTWYHAGRCAGDGDGQSPATQHSPRPAPGAAAAEGSRRAVRCLVGRGPHSAGGWAEAAADGFKQLASGDHVGRVVLAFPPPGQRLRVHAPARDTAVRRGGAYIVTGGTRGLGLEAVRWLAEDGAGRVVVGGRGDLAPEAADVLRATAIAGCEVEVVRGDIADPDTARRLVAAAGGELRGVLHTAVVLDDTPITGLTPDRIERVWRPKVNGVVNLHEATRDHVLDWFIVFSSMSAMLGNAGQANYAAAGTWVDVFAKWRSDQGLTTLSVNWGAWGEAGRATHFAARGFDTISTADGFTALGDLLRHQRVNTGVFDYQPDVIFRAFPHVRRNPLLAELDSGAAVPDGAAPVSQVRAEAPGPARALLVQEAVVHTLATLLGARPSAVPAHAKFTDIGLDSLLAVALTRKLQSNLDIAVTPAEVWAHPSPAELSAHIESALLA